MSNSKRKCKYCTKYVLATGGIKTPVGFFCNISHAQQYASEARRKQAERSLAKQRRDKEKENKAVRRDLRERKKALKTKTQWFAMLQKLVNQYVVHVKDKDKPCFTCGTTNQNIKYDAGHMIAIGRGGADRRRFNLFNIHKQCSQQCNVYGSGMRKEYEIAFIAEYGKEKLDWLLNESNFLLLKDLFPHWSDVEKEIIRYRKLLRDNGLKPRC